ncbi:MAG: tryptophan synthase subunit alpha [Verrucomicrobia bacterium]|nr:tryptophan synthase subunit alpha [Verrucomicrobiota bacterium]MCF7709354.1 tryptophan synthase subunit alpha [Verrucomicrobiota bacterium]
MNRIQEKFSKLSAENRSGLIVYIGAGDPDLDATRRLALEFDRIGVDILELGIPFSDPLADGTVNQLAAQRGLRSGTTPTKVLETVAGIRAESQIPIVLYVYFNLVHRYGLEKFIHTAADVGVDGLLVLDLPPEEATEYSEIMHKHDLCPIFLIAPTTPDTRIRSIAYHASGFIYYVSREGVTGARKDVASGLKERVSLIRSHTKLPIAVGFGISTPDHVARVAAVADAAVVGSAIVNKIAEHGQDPDLIAKVSEFVEPLVKAAGDTTRKPTTDE